MANHTNKILCGLLALSAGFVLASCDTVNALPKTYSDPIVERLGEGEYTLTDNEMGKLWENIVSGKAQYIHDEVIHTIAKDQFGQYFSEPDVVGIYDIEDTDDVAIKAFIEKHPAVFAKEGDAKLAGEADVYETVRKPRFLAFKKDINKRLAEKLYSEITSGSYNYKDGRFSELKLALAHYWSGYDIKEISFDPVTKLPVDDSSWKKLYITAGIAKDDLEVLEDKVIHVERYKDYLEKKVLPDIYSEKLIEEYILQNKYSTLGRAYARDVSYVKLSYDDSNKDFAKRLLRYYGENIINTGTYPASDKESGMEQVANTWRGLKDLSFDVNGNLTGFDYGDNYTDQVVSTKYVKTNIIDKFGFTAAELTILANSLDTAAKKAEEAVILEQNYIKESKLGALLERYGKACRAVIDSSLHQNVDEKDESELNTFTGTNAHSRVKGIKDELSKLVLEDYTADEWGLKNGGFSDLPSTVRDRLFNINVANAVDGEDFTGTNAKYAENSAATMGSYATSGKYSYVRYIYNHYYLNKANAQRYEDDKFSYIFDEDNAYTIVNIKDAANSTKLNVDNDGGYYTIKRGQAGYQYFTELTAREIAKLLGTKESYKSDAYQHYLEKYNLAFSDQEIYDYFVSAYPDLYGED